MPWNPTVLQRVRHLHLRARTLTDSLLMGEHASRRVGEAVEFADYTEYTPGMDLRFADWKAYGRTDRLVVKRFQTETQLPCTVVLDLSGDLSTGEACRDEYPDLDGSKAGYAITLAATLLYFLHRHGEPVGLEVVAGKDVRWPSIPPRRGRGHLQRLFTMLAGAKPGGRADLRGALVNVGSRTPRRSWIAVLSDGMEEPSEWLPALAAFARRRTDLCFAHVYDPDEWALSLQRPAQFFSPEGGGDLAVDPQAAQEAFAAVVAEYVAEVESGVVRWGGRYVRVSTGHPMETAIARIVATGSQAGDVSREAATWG